MCRYEAFKLDWCEESLIMYTDSKDLPSRLLQEELKSSNSQLGKFCRRQKPLEFFGGINGSIIYDLDRPKNADLNKSVKVLHKAKIEIRNIMPVSWADLIAVAGAEAVTFCGGPNIPVQIGRLDVRLPDPPGRLHEETFDASALKNCFQTKGFSTHELIALSGAHTIGNKGFGNPFSFDNAYYQILLEKPYKSSGSQACRAVDVGGGTSSMTYSGY